MLFLASWEQIFKNALESKDLSNSFCGAKAFDNPKLSAGDKEIQWNNWSKKEIEKYADPFNTVEKDEPIIEVKNETVLTSRPHLTESHIDTFCALKYTSIPIALEGLGFKIQIVHKNTKKRSNELFKTYTTKISSQVHAENKNDDLQLH